MIEIRIEGFEDLVRFIKLFKNMNDEEIKELTKELNQSTVKLEEAIKKET